MFFFADLQCMVIHTIQYFFIFQVVHTITNDKFHDHSLKPIAILHPNQDQQILQNLL